jgi:hypothetical protein
MFLLFVCTVYGLTHFAQCMHNALCKIGTKQVQNYIHCTYIYRYVQICMHLWRLKWYLLTIGLVN